MSKKILELLIQKIKLQIQILQIQLAIKLLKQKRTVPNLPKPVRIILHHGGGWLDAAEVNVYHKHKWGFKSSLGYYMGYHYFIERNGDLFQARKDTEEGAHTTSPHFKPHELNRTSIGICLMGNGEEKDFTPGQMTVLANLVEEKRKEYDIPRGNVYGHKDFIATLCPSWRLYQWIGDYKKVV